MQGPVLVISTIFQKIRNFSTASNFLSLFLSAEKIWDKFLPKKIIQKSADNSTTAGTKIDFTARSHRTTKWNLVYHKMVQILAEFSIGCLNLVQIFADRWSCPERRNFNFFRSLLGLIELQKWHLVTAHGQRLSSLWATF